MRYRRQGFTAAQAKYLTKPYEGMGSHFVPRRWKLPQWFTDSGFNVLAPKGISRGRFYELHYRVDPHFLGARFPVQIGRAWSGDRLGLTKYGWSGRLWFGSPDPLKRVIGFGALESLRLPRWYYYFNENDLGG